MRYAIVALVFVAFSGGFAIGIKHESSNTRAAEREYDKLWSVYEYCLDAEVKTRRQK